MFLDQERILEKLVTDTGMVDLKAVKSPTAVSAESTNEEEELLSGDDKPTYQSVAGNLLYLAVKRDPTYVSRKASWDCQ